MIGHSSCTEAEHDLLGFAVATRRGLALSQVVVMLLAHADVWEAADLLTRAMFEELGHGRDH